MITWNYGGGTQSIAIACLIDQGRLPKPDKTVIADTGYEFRATWDYTQRHDVPLLSKHNIEIEIAPHSLATVDLYAKNGDLLLPAYDVSKPKIAKLPTFCSGEWKTRVVRRYLRKQGITSSVMWLGFSLDEIARLKTSFDDAWPYYYPLCFDMKLTRNECRDLVVRHGLALPIRSRCKMCPHQGDEEWLEVKEEPEEWREAIEIDAKIFASHGVRLHRSGKPLDEVELKVAPKESGTLFDDCGSGYCWT